MPAIVWVHENIRGHLYEHYIPYIREATARGFVVIAPEYRGSIGYGQALLRRDRLRRRRGGRCGRRRPGVLALRYPAVDPSRIGIIGWSHGGLIALLSVFRNPATFKAAAAMVPVTNLFHRLARKGVERQRRAIDPQNRFGGSPSERPEVYRDRSPLFHVDELQIPLLVHVAENDEDVNIDEAMQLVDALRARKPSLADIKVYREPARRPHVRPPRQRPGRGSRRTRPSSGTRGSGCGRSSKASLWLTIEVRPHPSGPVAQLGARMNGIHEVTGSIPVWSTISKSLILND